VAAPLPNGRRSGGGVYVRRRRTVADGESELRRELGLDRMLKRRTRSPGSFL
jgi:hypothetical protein